MLQFLIFFFSSNMLHELNIGNNVKKIIDFKELPIPHMSRKKLKTTHNSNGCNQTLFLPYEN